MRILTLVLGLIALTASAAPSAHGQVASDSTYTVESGDTLYGIAKEVGVSVRTLMEWNNLDDAGLQVGQTLRIRPQKTALAEDTPQAEQPTTDSVSEPAPPTSRDTTASTDEGTMYSSHVVEAGATLVDLALRLGTTADTLFTINDSTSAPIPAGATIRIPGRFGPPTHTVESGETLYSIAGEYGVSVRALKSENDLDENALEPGQRLQIPRGSASIPTSGEWAPPDSTGKVAAYPNAFAGRLTASGTTYEPDDFVVSHPSLPFNSVVLLSSSDGTRHTFARVIDRGPVEEGVLLDVSTAVARTLGVDADGSSTVALRVVWIDHTSN